MANADQLSNFSHRANPVAAGRRLRQLLKGSRHGLTDQHQPVMAGFLLPVKKIQTAKRLKVGAFRSTGKTGNANQAISACDHPKTAPRLRLHWTYR